MSNERRFRMDLMSPAELAIINAMAEIEILGADTNLTEAIVTLQRAKDLVSDYLDSQSLTEPEPPKPPVTPPGPKS